MSVIKLVAKLYSVASMILGFMLILGTVGALDVDPSIPISDGLVRLGVAFAMGMSGAVVLWLVNREAVKHNGEN